MFVLAITMWDTVIANKKQSINRELPPLHHCEQKTIYKHYSPTPFVIASKKQSINTIHPPPLSLRAKRSNPSITDILFICRKNKKIHYPSLPCHCEQSEAIYKPLTVNIKIKKKKNSMND